VTLLPNSPNGKYVQKQCQKYNKMIPTKNSDWR
jgi:hypothetical protein